jgi:DNA-binding transcriptional LysR family regulator
MPETHARFLYKQNRLKQLRAFCHTVQTGTVSAAAERMFLSQPAVSLLIQALERDLGAKLFERRGPRIALTPEGEVLLDISRPLLEGIEALPHVFAERCRNSITGELTIAAGESTILYILPGVIKHFQALYPHVRFHVHNAIAPHALAMVRANEVDLGVGSMLEVPDDIEYRGLYTCGTVLITPLSHPLNDVNPVTLKDISPHGLVLPPPPQHAWHHVDRVFRQHGLRYEVVLEAGGWEAIKRFVTAGLGISIVSSVCLQGDEDFVVRSLDAYFPKRSYGLMVRAGKRLSPAALRFIDLIDAAHRDPAAPPPAPARGARADGERRSGPRRVRPSSGN